jgi:N-acetyl-alpha-D-glucosaminyl L-malate synthase BshA
MLVKSSIAGIAIENGSKNAGVELITPHIASLKVGILCLGGLGGSGKVGTELAEGLAAAGASISLLTSQAPQWLSHRHPSLCYVPVSAPKTPTAPDSGWITPLACEIVEHVEKHQIAVLNVHYAVGLVEAALLAKEELASRGQDLAICLTLHGSDVTGFGRDPNYSSQLREYIVACDGVTAVSHWLADTAVEILGLATRPRVIYNAVNLELFRPFRKLNHAPSGILNLCHVSNFRSVKRPLDAIEVLAHVRASGVNARLFMIGDGPLAAQAREHALALNVANDVVFVGAVSPTELTHWFGVSDILLVTSESESFCLAALEAMACGVPVVGTHCGGLEEVITALAGGMGANLLSARGDVAAMAAKVVRLFYAPKIYQMLCKEILTNVKFRFSRFAQLRSYGNVFNELQQEVRA